MKLFNAVLSVILISAIVVFGVLARDNAKKRRELQRAATAEFVAIESLYTGVDILILSVQTLVDATNTQNDISTLMVEATDTAIKSSETHLHWAVTYIGLCGGLEAQAFDD